MKTHVDNVITSCGQALYAMKILKSHGLPQECLHVLFQSTILFLCASQAWYGFASEEDERLDSFIRKSVKSSFASPDLPSFRQHCEKKMTFYLNQFVQTKTMFLWVSFLQSRKQATISGPELMTLPCPVLKQTNWLTKISSIESFSKTLLLKIIVNLNSLY